MNSVPQEIDEIERRIQQLEIEKEAILATLEDSDGNKSETARRLGIDRKTLYKKLKTYEID